MSIENFDDFYYVIQGYERCKRSQDEREDVENVVIFKEYKRKLHNGIIYVTKVPKAIKIFL